MMEGRFAALSSKYNMYCTSKCTSMPYISLRSQRNLLSYDMKHVVINGEIIQLEGREFEKLLFRIHFFYQDISLSKTFRNTKS